MNIFLFFFITLINATEFKFTCQFNATEYNITYSKEFITDYEPIKCGCPHIPDGTIKFSHKTSASDMGISYKFSENENEVTFIPTISYEYSMCNKTEKNKCSSYTEPQRTSETLALSKNDYKISIILSYEFRRFEQTDKVENNSTQKRMKKDGENTQENEQENTQTTTQNDETDTSMAHYYSCQSDVFDVSIGSEIAKHIFKASATANQKCSGNHGSISCNLVREPSDQIPDPKIKEKCVLQLEGHEHIEGKEGVTFEKVPVGKYHCQYVTPYCTFSGEEIEVLPKSDCKPIEEWLDYQLYGEGQIYFYIGFVIGAIALLLNLIMLICSFKLCCSAEGSVERLAEEIAAEYRSRHGMEMR